MYYLKSSKIVSSILIALGLVITLAHLDSRVGATNRSLPFHLQARVQSEPPASAPRVNGKIAFSSSRNGYSTSLSDIYAMDADGSNQRQLTFTQNLCGYFQAAYAGNPVWSPDGKKVAFGGLRKCTQDIRAPIPLHGRPMARSSHLTTVVSRFRKILCAQSTFIR